MPGAGMEAHAAAAITMIQLGRGHREPLRRAKFLADAGVETGWALEAAVAEFRPPGRPWAAAGLRLPGREPILYLGHEHGGGEVSQARTDAHAATTVAMIQMAAASQDPLRRAQILADAQMQLGWTLRAAVEECQQAGSSWADIGKAVGLPRETVFRQYQAGGPIIKAKPVQSKDSPGITEMHRPAAEAIYAFASQTGVWFGPHEALLPGEFTDGRMQFAPAEPVTPFAGQQLTVRYGPWDSSDVSVHAPLVTAPDGQPRRVRATNEVIAFLFGDAEAPLRQAMHALVNATQMHPRLDTRLLHLIDNAASAMRPGLPAGRFITAVEAIVAQGVLAEGDGRVMTLLHRLQRLALEYRAWETMNAARR